MDFVYQLKIISNTLVIQSRDLNATSVNVFASADSCLVINVRDWIEIRCSY